MTKKTITSFDDLVQAWTNRMMELDHKVTANRRSIEGLENQIDETYKEMEDIEKAAHDLLGDKVQFNLYENEDNAIRILYKSHSMVEPKVNIVKDRKIQVGKEPKQFEKYCFDTGIESTVADEETGSWSSIKQGIIGVDEYGKYIQGIKVSVGNTNSEAEPETQHYRVRLPESSVEVTPDEIKLQGDTITFGKDVKLAKYEEQFNSLSSKVDTLEKDISESIELLEEWLTPKQDPVPMDFDEENTSDKTPVLSEEIDEKTESAIGLISSLDEEHLEMLYDNLDGTYVFDMDDFYSLVLQLFILQKASQKRK